MADETKLEKFADWATGSGGSDEDHRRATEAAEELLYGKEDASTQFLDEVTRLPNVEERK